MQKIINDNNKNDNNNNDTNNNKVNNNYNNYNDDYNNNIKKNDKNDVLDFSFFSQQQQLLLAQLFSFHRGSWVKMWN